MDGAEKRPRFERRPLGSRDDHVPDHVAGDATWLDSTGTMT
jgi:hypothetical protein